jgi:hypothetical protein
VYYVLLACLHEGRAIRKPFSKKAIGLGWSTRTELWDIMDSLSVTDIRVVLTDNHVISDNHENSVFLHVDGYGWLFENIGNLKCMELMLYPDKRVKDREKEKVIRDTSD